ncbi:MAG: methylmalonyl-CoA epimerase [Flavobacteriia bacterium]|nr:methylmalonyl-CoA epimerase [Flavobacteriia bacterium]
MKIEHIGIAVLNLESSIPLYEKIFQTNCYKIEEVESEKVKTAFFKIGDCKIELLQATDESSTIHKFIEKKGEGIHHIAFNVDNVNNQINRLIKSGIESIHQQAKEGADNKLIAFLHPKSTGSVLMELCQDKEIE